MPRELTIVGITEFVLCLNGCLYGFQLGFLIGYFQ
jgi:hypothetical protein